MGGVEGEKEERMIMWGLKRYVGEGEKVELKRVRWREWLIVGRKRRGCEGLEKKWVVVKEWI